MEPEPGLPIDPAVLSRLEALLAHAEEEPRRRRGFPAVGCLIVLTSSMLAIGSLYGFWLLVERIV